MKPIFRAAPGFRRLRAYNSHVRLNFGLGVGWISRFQKRLIISTTANARVYAQRGNGHAETYSCVTFSNCTKFNTEPNLARDSAGYTLTNPDGTTERYNTAGLLLTESGRSGSILMSYDYDEQGRVASVTGRYGHSLNFTYDASGHVASLTDPGSAVYSYSYDANNNLVRVSYPDGTAKQYHYERADVPNALTGISYVDTDASVSRYSSYGYDDTGAVATSTALAGGMEAFTISYDSPLQATITDASGTREVLTFALNGGKYLSRKTNQTDGKSVKQVFDSGLNLRCREDQEGRVTRYNHNSPSQLRSVTSGLTGNCSTSITTPETRTIQYVYLSGAPNVAALPIIIQSPGVYGTSLKKTNIVYDGNRYPRTITQSGYTPTGTAVSRSITTVYSAEGQLISIDGPRTDVSDVTTLAYNACTTGAGCGQLASVTNALGQTTTYNTYDANGRVTEITDPNGVRTNYSYDLRGRVLGITVSPPAGQGAAHLTQYTYDAAGNVTQVIFPDNRTLTYTYDAAHYLRTVTDNLGNKVAYSYDLKGNRTAEQTLDPAGTLVGSIEQAYDSRNRLSQINAAGSLTQQLHDAVGNLIQETDPNQSAAATPLTTTHDYDALNRLLQTVDNLSGVTNYSYDVNDRLKQVTAPNSATTQYSYDDLGNLLSETSPDRGTLSYTHDAAGNVLTITDARGVTATYTYDALNRVTAITYPNPAENVTLSYDTGTSCAFGIGRVCQVSDESGLTQYAYDAFGNIAEHVKTELGVTYITGYTYDAADRVLSLTYPDGRLVHYPRDALGRITGVSTTKAAVTSTVASNITYRADGLMTGIAFGNGLSETRTYDLQGRLTQQTRGPEVTAYSYDPNGNLTASPPRTFDYDALDRLSAGTLFGGVAYQIGYDANGNRVSATAPGQAAALNYAPASNRLVGLTVNTVPQAVTLDAAGNLVRLENGQSTLAYNGANRVAEVTHLGAPLVGYTYNYLGLRTRKTSSAGRLVYHYDQRGQLLMETTAAGVALRTYLWRDNAPLAQVTLTAAGPRLLTLHTDHLNTPRAASNAVGTVVWRWAGEAFGSTAALEDPDGDGIATRINLRFPGQYFDAETGFF